MIAGFLKFLGREVGKSLATNQKKSFMELLGLTKEQIKKRAASRPIPKPAPWKLQERGMHRGAIFNADPRWDYMRVAYKVRPETDIPELSQVDHVSSSYLQDLIGAAKTKPQVELIMSYVKSASANNLTAHTRADLCVACLDKLRHLDVLLQFLT